MRTSAKEHDVRTFSNAFSLFSDSSTSYVTFTLGQVRRYSQLCERSRNSASTCIFLLCLLHIFSYPAYRGLFQRGYGGRGLKLTTHLQLALRSSKRDSLHTLHHSHPWRSACTGTALPFHVNRFCHSRLIDESGESRPHHSSSG
jgi:hypothetical protein